MFLSGIPNPIIDSNTSKIREISYGEQLSDSTNSTHKIPIYWFPIHQAYLQRRIEILRLCWGGPHWGDLEVKRVQSLGEVHNQQSKNASFELLSIGGGENGRTPQGREEASRKPRNEGLALQMDKLYQGTVLSPQICFNALACLFRVIKSDGLFSKTGCSPTTGTRLRWLTHAGGASSSSC